jgi:hypothetical protein
MKGEFRKKEKDAYAHLISDKNAQINYGSSADHSPEAQFISALIDTGIYIPGIYGVRSEQIVGHKPVHEFCVKYQEISHSAPPIHILKERFAQFPYIAEANPVWAASVLSEAHTNRVLRQTMSKASASLAEDANDEAINILQDGLSRIQPAVGMGIDATDLTLLEDMGELETCPVPQGMLHTTTGGIASGDMWIIAARLGVGKSWKLIQHAVAAAEGGWDVAFFSLEMPAKSVLDRIHRVALKQWKEPWVNLELDQRSEMLEEWAQDSGTISVYDPTKGRCDASVLSAIASEKTLIIVDYIGLMHTTSGARAIEDWRAMATISNQVKEVALSQNVPIIAAAQINRAGGNSDRSPGTEHLAQSDALGQDADAVITLKQHSKRVLVNSLTKYRHGESGAKWFTQFEPGRGMLGDLSISKATEMKMEDDESDASQLG